VPIGPRDETGTGTVGLHWRRVDAVVGGAAGEPARALWSDVAVAVDERNVRGAFDRCAEPGRRRRPSDRHPRPSDPYVRKEPGKRPAAPSIRGVRSRPGCVASCLSLYCVGVALPLNCWIFICVLDLIKNCLWPSVALGLISDTTELVFF